MDKAEREGDAERLAAGVFAGGNDPALPPAAQRALAEAEARRAASAALALPREIGGRQGPEPVRYGDWERNGIAIDF